jgi:hypothetical protein
MVICGVAALALYSVSWIFRLLEWPGVDALRIAAVFPFLVGAGIWIYDWRKKAKAQAGNKKRGTGWEDILEDGEEDER